MIIICGKTIAEVERDLEMAKAAIATGAPIGVGGATMADVEQAMRGLHTAMGEHSPTEHKCDCEHTGCACGGGVCFGCGCADEEEVEYCPVCDCELDEDGYCDNCDYPDETEGEDDEDEPPIVTALADMLRSFGVDEATIGKLMQSALGL